MACNYIYEKNFFDSENKLSAFAMGQDRIFSWTNHPALILIEYLWIVLY